MTAMKADDRKLMVQNLLNGVSAQQVAQVFDKTEAYVSDLFNYSMVKIRSYLFERAMPPIPCDTLQKARENRMVLLGYLEKVNLDRSPKFKTVEYSAVDSTNLFDIRTGR